VRCAEREGHRTLQGTQTMLFANLCRLNDAQSKLRDDSVAAIAEAPDLTDHAVIIEHWMDVILFFSTQYEAADENELTCSDSASVCSMRPRAP
jgi:hypothetical protein